MNVLSSCTHPQAINHCLDAHNIWEFDLCAKGLLLDMKQFGRRSCSLLFTHKVNLFITVNSLSSEVGESFSEALLLLCMALLKATLEAG